MNRKPIFVHNRYLVLPIGKHVNSRKILIWSDDRLVDDFDLRLDYINPCEYVYYDLKNFFGKTIELAVQPEMEILDRQTSHPLPQSSQSLNYRPRIHFTPKHGWINDPNGLLEYTSPVTGKKIYHLFYQYNPYDVIWGNMHWGHAISEDLLHWEELPIALYPDDDGTMFSGSAIIDYENRTGLKQGDEHVILLYYTCAGHTSVRSTGKPFTQCLAYSTDGGITFEKYKNNPVVPHIAEDNRDPKVIWCEEMGRYLMALYLNDSNFAILVSDDLLHWEHLQNMVIEGEAECPDIYPLYVDGNPNQRKWILSGASHLYVVCEYRNGRFEIVQSPRRLHYGRNHYAAQTFSDVSDGRRIGIAWNRELEFPRAPFYGQMSIPFELTLRSRKSEYDLCAQPIAQLHTLNAEASVLRNIEFTAQEPWSMPLLPAAYRIYMDMGHCGNPFTINIFGQDVSVQPQKNRIQVKNNTVPLAFDDREKRLLILVDSCSIELFTGDGQAIMTAPLLCDYNLKRLILSSEHPVRLELLEISRLEHTVH